MLNFDEIAQVAANMLVVRHAILSDSPDFDDPDDTVFLTLTLREVKVLTFGLLAAKIQDDPNERFRRALYDMGAKMADAIGAQKGDMT